MEAVGVNPVILLLFVGVILLLVIGGMAAAVLLSRSWGRAPSTPLQKRVRFETPASTDEIEATLRALVADGQAIEAIKLVRAQTGMGLTEAKDYVDRL